MQLFRHTAKLVRRKVSFFLHEWNVFNQLNCKNVSSFLCVWICRLDTIDGTATAGEDYVKLSEEFEMEPGQKEKTITILVIDDNQWEPDETFFVKLSLPEGEEINAKLGSKTVALVTIINDDGRYIRSENNSHHFFGEIYRTGRY